jgi:hypothetical protein
MLYLFKKRRMRAIPTGKLPIPGAFQFLQAAIDVSGGLTAPAQSASRRHGDFFDNSLPMSGNYATPAR